MKELLNKFYMEKCDTAELTYYITPIDNTHEVDDKEYWIAVLDFLANNYRVDALSRMSSGNSHDAYWQREVIIFNDDGVWKEELDAYKEQETSLYEDKPIIINKDELTEEIIDEWSNRYNLSLNGEEIDERFVLCSDKDGTVRLRFSLQRDVKVYVTNSTISGMLIGKRVN